MAFPAFGELGCCGYVWRWLPETFPEAWAALDSAPELAGMLVRLGSPFDDVVAPARLVDQGGRLDWRTPEAAHNAVMHLCDLVPEAELQLCEAYREQYPTELVAEKFLEFLGRGPGAVPERIEPVYLGRP